MYRLGMPFMPGLQSDCVILDKNIAIPFDPANTDYQTFKAQINAGEAELQDADGKKMTAKAAKAFVATLP